MFPVETGADPGLAKSARKRVRRGVAGGFDPEQPKSAGPRTAAVQRLEPVAGGRCTHSDCHKAAVGYGNRCLHEWQLYEVLRT